MSNVHDFEILIDSRIQLKGYTTCIKKNKDNRLHISYSLLFAVENSPRKSAPWKVE